MLPIASIWRNWRTLIPPCRRLTGDENQRIRKALDSETCFVAEKIGVPSLAKELHAPSGGRTADDHGWHEFHVIRPAIAEDADCVAWGTVTEMIDRLTATA